MSNLFKFVQICLLSLVISLNPFFWYLTYIGFIRERYFICFICVVLCIFCFAFTLLTVDIIRYDWKVYNK